MKYDRKIANQKFKKLLKIIKAYDKIVIYRHLLPDFDALGTQMGLYYWIKENFPQKEVHYVGEGHRTFIPTLFPEPQVLSDEWYDNNKHLAIVVDTATKDRISLDKTDKADYIFKIDHHLNVDQYGNDEIVFDDFAAASQIVALFEMVYSFGMINHYTIGKDSARALYIGLVGDTGRFQYQDTTPLTFQIASALLETGINMTEIYNQMYKSSLRSLNFLKFVLNNYKTTEKGTCYYILRDEDLKALDVDINEGKLHINTFRNVEGVNIVASITEDREKGEWRVSLRSAHTKVVDIANRFGGGGHEYAAGAKLSSLDELPDLIKALDEAK